MRKKQNSVNRSYLKQEGKTDKELPLHLIILALQYK